jgi:hypothetical protein
MEWYWNTNPRQQDSILTLVFVARENLDHGPPLAGSGVSATSLASWPL